MPGWARVTVLDRLDLGGRAVLPFVAHAVSGMGRVAKEYQSFARGAMIG